MCSTSSVPEVPAGAAGCSALERAVAALEAGVDTLASVPEWHAADGDLTDCLIRLTRLSARLDSQRLRLVAEADERGVSTARGAASMGTWLKGVLRVRPGVAAREVELARSLRSTCVATGEALSAGRITTDAAAAITSAVERLPRELADRRGEAEEILLAHACEHDPAALARIARHLRVLTEPGPDEDLAEDFGVRNRELHLSADPDDGRVHLRGWLDAEAGSLLRSALDAFNSPQPGSAAGPDTRRPATRTADALVELVRGACDGGGLPTSGGQRPHLTVTLDWDTLRAQTLRAQSTSPARAAGGEGGGGGAHEADGVSGAGGGVGSRLPVTTSWDGLLTPATARRLACDAKVVPVVLASEGQPLDVGRASYTVPAPMRAALVARDQGCAFPACERPSGWCHAHHIEHWADGGPTALRNLVLLCGAHHRLIHHRDWTVRLDPDGHPAFLPPRWIDPDQTPRKRHWRADLTTLSRQLTSPPSGYDDHPPPDTPGWSLPDQPDRPLDRVHQLTGAT